jgi:hypothetical protein
LGAPFLGQVPGIIQWRRASGIVGKQMLEVVFEFFILAVVKKSGFQFF